MLLAPAWPPAALTRAPCSPCSLSQGDRTGPQSRLLRGFLFPSLPSPLLGPDLARSPDWLWSLKRGLEIALQAMQEKKAFISR